MRSDLLLHLDYKSSLCVCGEKNRIIIKIKNILPLASSFLFCSHTGQFYL